MATSKGRLDYGSCFSSYRSHSSYCVSNVLLCGIANGCAGVNGASRDTACELSIEQAKLSEKKVEVAVAAQTEKVTTEYRTRIVEIPKYVNVPEFL